MVAQLLFLSHSFDVKEQFKIIILIVYYLFICGFGETGGLYPFGFGGTTGFCESYKYKQESKIEAIGSFAFNIYLYRMWREKIHLDTKTYNNYINQM